MANCKFTKKTHPPPCISSSFSQNSSRLLLPKRFWNCASTISFMKYRLSCKSRNGDLGNECGKWWERAESGWKHRESRWECREWGWECWECRKFSWLGWKFWESGWEYRELGWFFLRIFVFIALAKIPEREESISASSLYGLPDY